MSVIQSLRVAQWCARMVCLLLCIHALAGHADVSPAPLSFSTQNVRSSFDATAAASSVSSEPVLSHPYASADNNGDALYELGEVENESKGNAKDGEDGKGDVKGGSDKADAKDKTKEAEEAKQKSAKTQAEDKKKKTADEKKLQAEEAKKNFVKIQAEYKKEKAAGEKKLQEERKKTMAILQKAKAKATADAAAGIAAAQKKMTDDIRTAQHTIESSTENYTKLETALKRETGHGWDGPPPSFNAINAEKNITTLRAMKDKSVQILKTARDTGPEKIAKARRDGAQLEADALKAEAEAVKKADAKKDEFDAEFATKKQVLENQTKSVEKKVEAAAEAKEEAAKGQLNASKAVAEKAKGEAKKSEAEVAKLTDEMKTAKPEAKAKIEKRLEAVEKKATVAEDQAEKAKRNERKVETAAKAIQVEAANIKLKASDQEGRSERKELKKVERDAKEKYEEKKDQTEEKILSAATQAKELQVDATAAKATLDAVKKEAKELFDAKHPRAVIRGIKNLKHERSKAAKVIQQAADAENEATNTRREGMALEKKLKQKEEKTINVAKDKEREAAEASKDKKSKARQILRNSVKVSKAKQQVEKAMQQVRKLRRKARGEIHAESEPILAKAEAAVQLAKHKVDVTQQLVEVLQRVKSEKDAEAKRVLELKATKLQAKVESMSIGVVETHETSVEGAKEKVRKARIAMGTATRGENFDHASKQLLEAKQEVRRKLRAAENHKSLDWQYDQAKQHLARVTKVLDNIKSAKKKSLSILRKAKKEDQVDKAKNDFQKASVLVSPKLRREVRAMEKKVTKDVVKKVINEKNTELKKVAAKGTRKDQQELFTLDF